MSKDQGMRTAATMPTICNKVEAAGLLRTMAQTAIAMAASMIHSLGVKAWPALMRFFQSRATEGGPIGRSKNGARLTFCFEVLPCQFPDLMAATRSAIL